MAPKKQAVVKKSSAGKAAKKVVRVLPKEKSGAEMDTYLAVGNKLNGAEESQMFGKPCFKINGKAFISLFDNEMVFKLTGKAHETAMKLKGAKLFDPSGKGRAMKEWVQVPASAKSKWDELAKEAMKYVKATTK